MHHRRSPSRAPQWACRVRTFPLPGHRGLGSGGALLERAYIHARNWGVHVLFMHGLTEHSAIMHLARNQGMDIVAQTGEADTWLTLPPADATSYMSEAFAQRAALFDHVLNIQLAGTRRAFVLATLPAVAMRRSEQPNA